MKQILHNFATISTIVKRNLLSLVFILVFLGAESNAIAQNYREWTGSGNNWSSASNWNPSGITYGQLEWKGNGLAASNNDMGAQSHWRMYFSGTIPYTITGSDVNLFDFGGAFSWILNDATAAQNINLNINFSDSGPRYSYITNRNSGSLTFGSGFNVGVTGASITALRIAGNNTAAPITFNGTISGSKPIDIGRDDANADQANTRVVFNGDNASSYSGVTSLYAGTLTIPENTALGTGKLILGNSLSATSTLAVTTSTTRSQEIQINNTSSASVIDVASGQTFELSGVLSGGATNTTKFGKSGSGTLTLTGTATYNGQIQIGDGSVIANSNTAISANTTTSARGVDLGLNVGDVSTGNNVSLFANSGFTVGNSIYVSSNASNATRTIGLNGSGSATFSNEIYMDGNLTVTGGSGTVTLGGRLTNTGGIIASGGIVNLTSSTNNFTGTSTVNSSAELRLNPTANATYTSQIVLNGGILSTTDITASRTFTSSSTLKLDANSTIALGSNAHTLTIDGSSAVTWTGSTLTITGWAGAAGASGTAGKIFFGNSSSGLTAEQLAKINFDGYNNGAIILSNGEVVPPSETTWDGSVWSNGTPDATKVAIINGDLTSSGAHEVKSLIVNSGKTVTVATGTSVKIENALVNNGTIIVENNANLIQTAVTNTNSGSGTATVTRNSNALFRFDFTMWSSPVSGAQTLAGFSPLTSQSPNRFYTYNPSSDEYSPATVTEPFAIGRGYLIRMPNVNPADQSLTTPYYLRTPTTGLLTYNGVFTGTLNNGTVTLSSLTSDKYYSVGNPYPSTISAATFTSVNGTDGIFYFWRKTNGPGTAYATYSVGMGTGSAGSSSIIPVDEIQVGQGFIVKSASASLSFTNAMRKTTPSSTQFLKTKKADKSRLWLDLSDATGRMNQVLIGYIATATLGVDAGIDGKYFNDSATALTSIIDGGEYVIQGRPTFDVTDVVALGFKTDVAGTYTIALNSFDGLFAAGQDIYLVDAVDGKEIDLKAGAYTFTATAGVDNARFSLKYQKTLKVIDATLDNNSVSVYQNNGSIYINSKSAAIRNVKVFDVQGRLIAEQRNVKANTAVISNLRVKNQLLIVNVVGEDNSEVSKKLMN